MMLSLGLFVFSIKTAPYQQLQRSNSQRWASNNRVGKPPAYQYLGQGEESIKLSGTLYPQLTGGQKDLAMLNKMAISGKAHNLHAGNGDPHGLWIIETVEQTHSHFLQDGTAKKIEFSLSLKRVDDNRVDQMGDPADYVEQLIDSSLSYA